jgi:CPA2 family monovalent cation:H+ antiporter-2
MTSQVLPGGFRDLLLFLATAGVVVPLFARLRAPPTLGFLAAGVLLGPHALGALTRRLPWLEAFTLGRLADFDQLAGLGVAFLLFTVGLELSWERLRLLRRLIFGLGALQLLITGLALSIVLGRFLPREHGALLAGVALALSSTAMTVPALTAQRRLHSAAGRAAFAVLLFQDLAVAPLLVAFAALSRPGGQLGPTALYSFAPALLVVAGLILAGRLLLRPMMKLVARAKSDELFMAAALLVVIGAGAATAAAGLPMGLGAFMAGLLLAETEYRHEVEAILEPFAGLLLGVFFLSVGLRLDVTTLARAPEAVLGLGAALLGVKTLANFAACRLFGLAPGASLEAALAVAGGGEFSFVILAPLARAGGPAWVQPLMVAITLSLFLTPALVALGARLERRISTAALPGFEEEAEPAPAVLIVGMGRVGQLVADLLDERGLAWRGVDRDPRVISAEHRRGRKILFGDGSKPELLRRLGLANALAVVVTMDTPDGVEAVVGAARHARPDLPIVARARDARHALQLYKLGATTAVPEAFEASLQVSEALLLELGEPEEAVHELIRGRRQAFRALLAPAQAS